MVQSMVNQDKQFTWSADAFIIILKIQVPEMVMTTKRKLSVT